MATDLSERSAYLYLRHLDRLAELLAERGTDLANCTGADIAAVSLDFVSSKRGQLRGAFLHAWQALGRDNCPPLRGVRIPPKPRRRSRALDHDLAVQLEQAAWDRNDLRGLAVLVGLYSGLRRAEIAEMAWDHLDRDRRTGRPIWMYVHGKGDVSAPVPIHPVLAVALDRFRGDAVTGSIFPGRIDGHVCANTIWEWTRRVAAEGGLGHVHPHLLRHTLLTEANDVSSDLRAVQEIARHSRPETTAGYTRVLAQKMIDVVSMVDYGRGIPGAAPPDPAAALPGVGYRQLIHAIEGSRELEVWIELGRALHQAGWKLELEGGPSLNWVHPSDRSLQASARHSFTLYHQRPDDEADIWELDSAEQLLAVAGALVAGIDVVGSVRLGSWIEEPFVEFLHGERPELLEELGLGRAQQVP